MSKTPTRDDIDDFIDSIDPATTRNARHLRKIAQARDALEAAEQNLQAAVNEARAAGDSWTMIGIALRTSKQNAHRKFAGDDLAG